MSLTLDTIRTIARTVVEPQFPDLRVVAVTSRDGDAGRAEVLVLVAGCHDQPCRLMLNLDRSDPTTLKHDLRTELARAITEHSVIE